MRPAGEVRIALLNAAKAACGSGQGATMRELASRACVGQKAARETIKNMVRAGVLLPVGERRVQYRNRPVLIYTVQQGPANEACAASASAH